MMEVGDCDEDDDCGDDYSENVRMMMMMGEVEKDACCCDCYDCYDYGGDDEKC